MRKPVMEHSLPIQPLIQPLFGGMSELEFLARLPAIEHRSGYEYVRLAFREMFGISGGDFYFGPVILIG